MTYVLYFIFSCISYCHYGWIDNGYGWRRDNKTYIGFYRNLQCSNHRCYILYYSTYYVYHLGLKQLQMKTKIQGSIAIPIALGSVAGGFTGERILSFVVNLLKINNMVLAVQNTLLSIIILGVYIYMKNKDKIQSKNYSGTYISLLVGFFLGIISSFLGIGGGPINVALIIYLFSFSTKSAVVCSIITILFAQISKLFTILLTTGFVSYDLTMLPAMMAGAVIGGSVGSKINKKIPEMKVELLFNIVQLTICGLAITNIIKSVI